MNQHILINDLTNENMIELKNCKTLKSIAEFVFKTTCETIIYRSKMDVQKYKQRMVN